MHVKYLLGTGSINDTCHYFSIVLCKHCRIQLCQSPPVRGPKAAGGCEVFLQTSQKLGDAGLRAGKPPAQQAGYRPWVIPLNQADPEHRLELPPEVATLQETAASSAALREPWSGHGRLPVPRRPSRDQEPEGSARRFLSLPGPAASAAPRVTRGRSYRERAPA